MRKTIIYIIIFLAIVLTSIYITRGTDTRVKDSPETKKTADIQRTPINNNWDSPLDAKL